MISSFLDRPFPLGLASFDPQMDRVLLWTAVHGHETCSWEVADDPSFTDLTASGEATVTDGAGTVTVDVGDLSPSTRYWYRFRTPDGATSETGRTKTLPAEGADHFRIAAVCCSRYGQSEFEAYRAVAEADVDLVVHLGDYIYEDDKFDIEGREPEPDHHCITLDDYRMRHAQARRDPDARALHAAHPMVVIWDDHDLADNAWREGAQGHDPDEQGPWAPRMEAALRAHQEFLPKRLADPDDLSSAWRRLDGGDLCSIVCTEGRAQRDEPAGNEQSAPADDPERTLLGPEQARWFEHAVTDVATSWVVVLSGTVMSELTLPSPQLLDGFLPEKYTVVDGCATNSDQWDGYLVERQRMAAALGRRNGGSLVLSGDIHSSWAIEGPLGPDRVPVAVELVCPPAATTPLGQLAPIGVGDRIAPRFEDQVPGVRWVDVDHRGYLTVDFTRDRAEAAWWWVDDPTDDESGNEGSSNGETRPAVMLGRRWTVPQMAPVGLVDPEPRVAPSGEPSPSPSTGKRGRPRRALRAVVLIGAAIGAVTAGRWLRDRAE